MNNINMDELFEEQAEKIGLDTYYASEKTADISTLSVDDWKALRKTGIGGSDAGAVMGVSHFKSEMTLWMEKSGMLPDEEVTPEKQFMFDYGHALEPVIAKYFAEKYGYALSKDNFMYRHPNGIMLADFDYLLRDPVTGALVAGLEIKTTMLANRANWRQGILGEGGKLPASYEWQIRHYMAVRNINTWYAICAFGNIAEDCVVVKVTRDAVLEKELLAAETKFWESVKNGTPPECHELSKEAFAIIANRREIPADKEAEPVTFEAGLREHAEKIIALQEENSALNKQIEKNKEQINAHALFFTDKMGESALGYLPIDEQTRYEVKFEDKRRTTIDAKKLLVEYPEAYNACAKVPDPAKPQRSFSMKKGYSKPYKKTKQTALI